MIDFVPGTVTSLPEFPVRVTGKVVLFVLRNGRNIQVFYLLSINSEKFHVVETLNKAVC